MWLSELTRRTGVKGKEGSEPNLEIVIRIFSPKIEYLLRGNEVSHVIYMLTRIFVTSLVLSAINLARPGQILSFILILIVIPPVVILPI